MLAIHTRFIGPSNTRGARIKAYASDGRSVTVGYAHELDSMNAHHMACVAFIQKHLQYVEPNSPMCYGDSADGRGYVFCFAQSTVQETA